MAFSFRYRYVDFQTVFTGAPGLRRADQGCDSPGTLYANELATDVGRTCWDRNEPLAVLDHHFSRDGQFPSASAAVLHKARLIREKFTPLDGNVIWLVTHKQPDFDAFASLYLARWLIEDLAAPGDWRSYGLHPDGCFDLPDRRAIDWFESRFADAPFECRWALQLAGYASLMDGRRPIVCPRERALHSVLYAALKRGRDYLNESSGATELFDEARNAQREHELNPAFDSVLEGNAKFAPELTLLKTAAPAYERDLARARKAVVYLPESEAPFPNFFKSVRDVAPAQKGKPPNPTLDHPTLSDTFRIPTDGIYLRDPQCFLFEEWARLDLQNSALGHGFEFTAIATSSGRESGTVNKSSYVFSIDPERADGRHLYTVWSRLQTKEVEALRNPKSALAAEPRPYLVSEPRAGGASKLLNDPWSDGHEYFGTIVTTPHRGTVIGAAGVRSDLRDDPVAEAVRSELENCVFLADAPTVGPCATVTDFAGIPGQFEEVPQRFDLDSPQLIPAPPPEFFRYASIEMRSDIPVLPGGITRTGLADQIADTLRRVLSPDLRGKPEEDAARFSEVVNPDSVGVVSARGIAFAYKYSPAAEGLEANAAAVYHNERLRDGFSDIVSLVRDITAFDRQPQEPGTDAQTPAWDDLDRRAAELRSSLVLPEFALLRQFCSEIGLEKLLDSMQSLARVSEQDRLRRSVEEQASRAKEAATRSGQLRGSVGWLWVVAISLYAALVLAFGFVLFHSADRSPIFAGLAGGMLALGTALAIKKPWTQGSPKDAWMLWLIVISYIVVLTVAIVR